VGLFASPAVRSLREYGDAWTIWTRLDDWDPFFVLIMGACFWGLLKIVRAPKRNARRSLAGKEARGTAEGTLTVGPDGIRDEDAYGHRQYPWAHFDTVTETKRLFIFHLIDDAWIPFSKQSLDQSQAAILQLYANRINARATAITPHPRA
jgi:hypothetical protein